MSKKHLTPATRRSLDELENLIHRFEPYWEQWSHSIYSPLSVKELRIINAYRTHYSHKNYAAAKDLTQKHVASAYHHAVRKLRQLNVWQGFEKWRVYLELMSKAISREGYNINSYVEPAARIQLPAAFFIELYEKFSAGAPIVLNSSEVKQPKLLANRSSTEIQAIHKSQLCIHLYLSPEDLDES